MLKTKRCQAKITMHFRDKDKMKNERYKRQSSFQKKKKQNRLSL